MQIMGWQETYMEKYYSGKCGWIDGTTQFHNLCRRFISEKSKVLELGAGPSNRTSEFLSKNAGSVTGLDVDNEVKGNRFLSSAYVYDGKRFPLPNSTFDVVVSDYVMEHVEHPFKACEEINRILVPGGTFVFRAPNVYHYVPVFSRFLPMDLSNWVRNLPSDAHDPYPTFYRFNSVGKCKKTFESTGFEIIEMELVEKQPSYGMKSRFLFFPLLTYERLVNSLEAFCHFRANIFCAAKKR